MAGILAQRNRAACARRYVLLLAAGASRRLGRPKMLLQPAGAALVRLRAEAVLAARPAGCLVVTGAAHGRVAAALAGLPVRLVYHRGYRNGQGSSIAAGIAALPLDASHVLLLAVDQWAIDARAIARLLRRAARRPLVASYAGTHGIPVVFPRTWFRQLAALRDERGARALLAGAAIDLVAMPEAARDLDTPADAHDARRALIRARSARSNEGELRSIAHFRGAPPGYT
jgi:molybdenum cofactor cytidylyltransferase